MPKNRKKTAKDILHKKMIYIKIYSVEFLELLLIIMQINVFYIKECVVLKKVYRFDTKILRDRCKII